MLERDHGSPRSRLLCIDCRKYRSAQWFYKGARQQEPSQRRCIGHEGRIWISPHNILSFEEVRSMYDNGRGGIQPCECPISATLDRRRDGRMLSVKFAWPTTSDENQEIARELAQTLKQAKWQFCPHRKSNDPWFWPFFKDIWLPYRFMREWRAWRKSFILRRSLVHECYHCLGLVHFQGYDFWTRTYEIRVERELCNSENELMEATNPCWVRQVMSPRKIERLSRQ